MCLVDLKKQKVRRKQENAEVNFKKPVWFLKLVFILQSLTNHFNKFSFQI